ncbi:MAG TPA: AAA family ATPase, partial [Draconibacterium sp.]|nr:AAA family ATPase [Draconibacterium sp.]
MALIHRKLQDKIESRIQPGKVIIIAGARRTGKTVLLKEIMKSFEGAYLYLNGEDYTTELILQNKGIEEYKNLIGNSKYLVIDEAQK